MKLFREDYFSEFIIPKVHKVKAIQLKREKFNLKMKDNCYYKILKEQDPKVDELPIEIFINFSSIALKSSSQ